MREGEFGDSQINKLTWEGTEASYAGKASEEESTILHSKLELGRAEIRQRLNTEVIENTEGINIERVNTFMEQYGLPSTTAMVFDESQFNKLESILGLEAQLEFMGGMHNHYSGVTAVFRDSTIERNNGTGITEAIIVHESIHATATIGREVAVSDGDTTELVLLPLGDTRDKEGAAYGDFYEEGLAEFMAYLYTRDVLELPDGFGTHDVHYEAGGVIVPGKYTYKVSEAGEEKYSVEPPSLAAYGLELLFMKSPNLFPLILKSRNSVEDRRRFIQELNALSPGLYQELRNLPYTEKGFNKGIWIIIERLYDNDVAATAKSVVDNPVY